MIGYWFEQELTCVTWQVRCSLSDVTVQFRDPVAAVHNVTYQGRDTSVPRSTGKGVSMRARVDTHTHSAIPELGVDASAPQLTATCKLQGFPSVMRFFLVFYGDLYCCRKLAVYEVYG